MSFPTRWFTLLLLVALPLLLAGCTRSGVEATIDNLTGVEHEVTILVFGEGDDVVFNETISVAAGEREVSAGTIIREEGPHHVRVALGNGTIAEERIDFSRTGGPDYLMILLWPDRLDLSPATA